MLLTAYVAQVNDPQAQHHNMDTKNSSAAKQTCPSQIKPASASRQHLLYTMKEQKKQSHLKDTRRR